MSADLNRNADLHLADLLSREIENTPSGELLAETAEDFGDRRALAREFDAAFSRAVARTRRQRISDRLKELVARVLAPPSWKPVAATAATLLVVIAGGLYATHRWGTDAPTMRDAAHDAAAELPKTAQAGGKDDCDRAQDLSLAIKACSKLIASHPDVASAYKQRGLAYSGTGDYVRAIADFDQAIKLVRNDARSYGLRGAAYWLAGDFDRAVADADEFIRLAPRDALGYRVRGFAYVSKSESYRALPSGQRMLTDFNEANKILDLAIADFNEAIKIAPKDEDYSGRGYLYYKKRDFARAVADLSEAIRLNQGSVLAHAWRGEVHEAMGERAKAFEDYSTAVALHARTERERDRQADAKLRLEGLLVTSQVSPDYVKAHEWYEKAAADGDAVAMVSLGALYANGDGVPKDYAKALAWLEKAAAIGNAEALGQLSWHALFAREFAQALDAAERALKADPEQLWVAANRAHALMFLGRAAEAREAYLMHRDKRIAQKGNKTWQQLIADDFDELRKAGLDHPQMAEIEGALGVTKQVWKAQSGSTVAVSLLAVLSGHAFEVDRFAFSPDGRRLAAASGGVVRVWDVRSTYAIHEFKVLFLPPITALAFGPDNVETFTVDGNGDTVVSLRDTPELQVKYYSGFPPKILSAVPTREGLYVVTAGDGNGARLFKDNKEIRAFRGHDGPVTSAALSPDRKLILTTSDDKTMRVWNAETGEQVAVLGDGASSIAYAAFSPDGRRVITISKQDPTAHIWDVATRARLTVLKGHTGPVLHAAFSPDGRNVITASADGTARLWNAESGEAVATLVGHTGPVTSVAFSPDGSLVATGSQDRTARLWRVRQ